MVEDTEATPGQAKKGLSPPLAGGHGEKWGFGSDRGRKPFVCCRQNSDDLMVLDKAHPSCPVGRGHARYRRRKTMSVVAVNAQVSVTMGFMSEVALMDLRGIWGGSDNPNSLC